MPGGCWSDWLLTMTDERFLDFVGFLVSSQQESYWFGSSLAYGKSLDHGYLYGSYSFSEAVVRTE